MKDIVNTVHTARTIMFSEISALISHRIFDESSILEMNLLKKQSKTNMEFTLKKLTKLYDFQEQNQLWKVFLFLWEMAEETDRRIMTLLYAMYKDDLLRISDSVIRKTPQGRKVFVEKILDEILTRFPEKYASTTALSAAQNIASSWKQAGFIVGKVRNIRVPVKPGYPAVVFALFLGNWDGLTGDELLKTQWIKTLELEDNRLKELVSTAAIHDIINFQQAGDVTVIQFDKLLNQIEA